MEQTFQVAVATGFGAAFGAIVGNVFVVLNGWRERRAQTRRHQAELAMRTALEQWKFNTEVGIKLARGGYALPFYTYAIPLLAVLDEMSRKKIDADTIGKLLARFDRVDEACTQHAKDCNKVK